MSVYKNSLYTRKLIGLFVLFSSINFTINTIDKNLANAQTASISGSATLSSGGTVNNIFDPVSGVLTQSTVTNGIISTVSAQVVLPAGLYFEATVGSPVVIVPAYTTFNGSNVVSTLSIGATGSVQISPNASTFTTAAAQILINAANGNVQNIDAAAAIVRAGAGINGLD